MIEKIAQEWEIRGFSCDVWDDPPGKRWENYSHETDELFMLLKGEVELVINDKICKPIIDEVVLIPANTTHSVRNIGKKKSRWLYGYKIQNANTSSMADFNR